MTAQTELVPLYEQLLAVAGMKADRYGAISMELAGETMGAVVKGKALVLPTKDQLGNPDWSKRVVFHPLCEDALNGESSELEVFRKAINTRLNYVIGVLALELFTMAASVARHKKLNPDQSEFVSAVGAVDEKTYNVMVKLCEQMMVGSAQKCFVNIFLKRGGSLKGERFVRVGVVSFPLFEELLKDEDTVFGVKLPRKLDRKAVRAFMEFIFPGIGEANHYSRGSRSDVAPFTEALMSAVKAVAGAINDTLSLFENQLEKVEYASLHFNNEWVETFNNHNELVRLSRALPPLPKAGTDATAAEPAKPASPAAQHQPYTPVSPYVVPTPHLRGGPAASSDTGKSDWREIVRGNPALAQVTGQMNYGGGGYAPVYDPVAARAARMPSWAYGSNQTMVPRHQQNYQGAWATQPAQVVNNGPMNYGGFNRL